MRQCPPRGLSAYQKHAAELLAIEASQEKLINLILGIYSAGLTLIAAMLKDARALLQGLDHTLSPLAWALIVVAVLIGAYAIYMSVRRNKARQAVRQGLLRVDQALGFFESRCLPAGRAALARRLAQFSQTQLSRLEPCHRHRRWGRFHRRHLFHCS